MTANNLDSVLCIVIVPPMTCSWRWLDRPHQPVARVPYLGIRYRHNRRERDCDGRILHQLLHWVHSGKKTQSVNLHVNAVRVDLGSIATLPLGTTGNRLHSSCFLWDNVVVGKQLSQSIRGLGRDDQRRRLPISKLLFQCHRYFRLLQAIFFSLELF